VFTSCYSIFLLLVNGYFVVFGLISSVMANRLAGKNDPEMTYLCRVDRARYGSSFYLLTTDTRGQS